MQIESPPTERISPKPTGNRRGLIIIHTGHGQDKPTAVFGLGKRCARASPRCMGC